MESMQNLFEVLSELYDKPPLLDEMNQIVNAVEKDKAEALNISAVSQRSELFFAVLKWAKQADLNYSDDMLQKDFEQFAVKNCG